MKALLGIVGGFVLTLAVFGSGLAFAAWLLTAKPVRQATPAIGVSELWTKDAQPVVAQKQGLERIPAQQAAGASDNAAGDQAAKPDSQPRTAALTTPAQPAEPHPLQPLPGFTQTEQPAPANGSTAQPAQQAPAQQEAQLPAAHLEWCANRYRSYRPEENSYRSYGGEIRPCISPYFDPESASAANAGQNDLTGNDQARNDTNQPTDDQAEMQGYADTRDGYATTYGGPPEEIAPNQQAYGNGRQMSGDHIDYCYNRYRSYDPSDNTYQPFDGGPRRQCE
ncbi:BA14K family protein [Mesorhizobium sp.]|uniref:BA14K family protein n=1 Tax=Mesorhizobium sp. TaxID=1871066 RepID=UPI0025DA129B|nr:BA14K family protein [Mesorhizobium sp.]